MRVKDLQKLLEKLVSEGVSSSAQVVYPAGDFGCYEVRNARITSLVRHKNIRPIPGFGNFTEPEKGDGTMPGTCVELY